MSHVFSEGHLSDANHAVEDGLLISSKETRVFMTWVIQATRIAQKGQDSHRCGCGGA